MPVTPSVRPAAWSDEAGRLEALRTRVFVDEQGVPAELEQDGQDAGAMHVLAELDGEAVGCGRLLADGRIGRLAVLPEHRGTGIGMRLLQALVDLAQERGDARVYLHAQEGTQAFYARAGFTPQGEAFEEAGIRHVTMRRDLDYRDWSEPVSRATYPSPLDQLVVALARRTSRELAILSPHLDPVLFATSDFLDALKALVRNEREARVRILVREARDLVRDGHGLVSLARRAPSKINLRCLPEHPDWGGDSLVLSDRSGLIALPGGPKDPGFFRPRDRARCESARGRFEELWRVGREDPEFRTLAL